MAKIFALTILTILYPVIVGQIRKSISYTPEPVPPSFSDWHWPLPAGDWQIDRGPCDSPLANNHGCDNYEERCAFDFSAIVGESENTPVLAPQSGRVVYVGQRLNTGIEVMLMHPDGRVSALYHLSKAVVEVDQYIEQGQVVGYTGHTGTTKSRLHFHVQPNAITRQCLPIQGLDEMDYPSATITSFNTSMEHLMLVNPPQPLLNRLPPVVVSDVATTTSTPLAISQNQQAILPVQLTGIISDTTILNGGGFSTILTKTVDGPLFKVLFKSYSSQTGQFLQRMYPNSTNSRELSFSLIYTIVPFINMSPSMNGIVLPHPKLHKPNEF